MKIAFLIRSLHLGGAERQLVALAKGLSARGHAVEVLTFYKGGPLGAELSEAGIPLWELDKRGRWDVLGFAIRLIGRVRRSQPDVLHGYLAVPNILLTVLRPFFSGARIVWGVRASFMDLTRYDWMASVVYRIECLLSHRADLIIANSEAGSNYAVANGFPPEKLVVCPNGIDTERYRPNATTGAAVRATWNVPDDATLIGLVGRLDPMKNHPAFLRAAAAVAAERPDVRFVCVGGGPESYAAELRRLANELGLSDKLIWAGPQLNMPAIYNALDLACSASCGEGFPNVIGEAMACGVPAVVTNVGDSAHVVGNTGWVAPPGAPDALTDALRDALVENNAARGKHARARIVEHFSLDALVTASEVLMATAHIRRKCAESPPELGM